MKPKLSSEACTQRFVFAFVRGLKKSFLSAFTKRSKKEKTGSSTEPPHDANIVLCAGHAKSELGAKSKSKKVLANSNSAFWFIRGQADGLEHEVNRLIQEFENKYKHDNGQKGVIVQVIGDSPIRFGLIVNKRALNFEVKVNYDISPITPKST